MFYERLTIPVSLSRVKVSVRIVSGMHNSRVQCNAGYLWIGFDWVGKTGSVSNFDPEPRGHKCGQIWPLIPSILLPSNQITVHSLASSQPAFFLQFSLPFHLFPLSPYFFHNKVVGSRCNGNRPRSATLHPPSAFISYPTMPKFNHFFSPFIQPFPLLPPPPPFPSFTLFSSAPIWIRIAKRVPSYIFTEHLHGQIYPHTHISSPF